MNFKKLIPLFLIWLFLTGNKTQRFDFKMDMIEVERPRFDYLWIESRKKAKHKSLIKMRDNFNKKMFQSVREL